MSYELVEFENSFRESKQDLGDGPFYEGALACTTIDGYPAGEDAQGQVVCRIWLTTDFKFIIDWIDPLYKSNQTVSELIEESKKEMCEEYGLDELAGREDPTKVSICRKLPDGTEVVITLNPKEMERVYYTQQAIFQMEDAKNYFEEYCKHQGMPGADKVFETEGAAKVFFQELQQKFEGQKDGNIPEDSLWLLIVEQMVMTELIPIWREKLVALIKKDATIIRKMAEAMQERGYEKVLTSDNYQSILTGKGSFGIIIFLMKEFVWKN